MGSGGGSQVVYYVPTTSGTGGSGAPELSGAGGTSCADGSCGGTSTKTVTPAVAKSIAGDTARAQQAQMQDRQRAFGISSTYNRYKNRGTQSGNTTLGGN